MIKQFRVPSREWFLLILSTLLLLDPMSRLGVANDALAENSASLAQSSAENLSELFPLTDVQGRTHDWDDFSQPYLVVAFLGTECPLAKLYGPRLAGLHEEFLPRGVAFVAIHSNARESISEIASFGRRASLRFPLFRDARRHAADLLGAERTPHVFVLDQDRRVRYRGRIDDQYGIGFSRSGPNRQDLRQSLNELLAGKEVSQPETDAVGCLLERPRETNEESPVTYSRDVARVLQQHCVECHRPGEIGPFSLTDYEDARSWAEAMAEVIREQRMPPWHASPQHGDFANARQMTKAEKELVYRWVEEGTPQGDPEQLPPPREYTTGWRLSRSPDVVIPMRDRPFIVPAEGTVEYQYFVMDPGFTEDKWIRGAEVIPGNRSVVHHAIVFVRAPEGREQRGLGWLTAYVPGQNAFELGSGQARFLPAGSQLVFQMHYTPTGSPQEDLTRVGLLFADPESVREELLTFVAINQEFEIPPFAEDYAVEASLGKFPVGSRLLAIAPHMHVRGKSFRVELVDRRLEKSSRILLEVPQYDFNWQHAYLLAEPLSLSDDYKLACVAHYNNSDSNLANPDPAATVHWGDQTWEEMMIAFFEIAVPIEFREKEERNHSAPWSVAQQQAAERAADELMRRFDRDGDGMVRRDEVPQAFRQFGFSRIDSNGDKVITRDEALEAARRSIQRKANGRGL